MPQYLIRGFDNDGNKVVEKEIKCSDDEAHEEIENTVASYDFYNCELVKVYEMSRIRVYRETQC